MDSFLNIFRHPFSYEGFANGLFEFDLSFAEFDPKFCHQQTNNVQAEP